MSKETYKYQYEKWHQDTKESRDADVAGFTDFINTHGLLPNDKNATIFDIGCGMGRFMLAYREKGYKKVSGIDIDDYQIAIAKKEKLDVQLGDVSQFFIKNKKAFDLVAMVDCLEHIEKNQQIDLLKKINKNLTPNGMLVIRVPNAMAPAFGYYRYIDFTHTMSYTETSLTYVLKNAGFTYLVFRPAWQETENVVESKVYYAKLLKAEFGIDDPILTQNIVAIAFKTQAAFEEYQASAPSLKIRYESKKTWWQNIINR